MKIGITADCSSGLEYAPFKHNIANIFEPQLIKLNGAEMNNLLG